MIKVISTEKITIKFWLDDIDESVLKQAKNLANLPFAFKWIAIMPDAHQVFDEAPGVYKDISVVMKDQSDFVDIVEELLPVAVIKG